MNAIHHPSLALHCILFIYQVDLVCHGQTPVAPEVDNSDPYAEPKRQNKFRIISSGNELTTEKLVQRIVSRRMDFESRNAKKEKKEMAAYEAYMKSKELENSVEQQSRKLPSSS